MNGPPEPLDPLFAPGWCRGRGGSTVPFASHIPRTGSVALADGQKGLGVTIKAVLSEGYPAIWFPDCQSGAGLDDIEFALRGCGFTKVGEWEPKIHHTRRLKGPFGEFLLRWDGAFTELSPLDPDKDLKPLMAFLSDSGAFAEAPEFL